MARDVMILAEALIDLYDSGPEGDPTGEPLFFGLCVEGLELSKDFNERSNWPSGRAYPRVHHVGETHSINIDRVFVNDSEEAFEFGRNKTYVLVIRWNDNGAGRWLQRTYYGVTYMSEGRRSQGVEEFRDSQRFRAEFYLEAPGES